MQYLSQSCITSGSNTYLSTKPLFFSTFTISKMRIVAKKPRKRQLNASESAILVILPVFVMTTMFNKDNSKTVQVFTVILAQN